MTSSTTNPNDNMSNKRPSRLTNFSIDAIIGGQQQNPPDVKPVINELDDRSPIGAQLTRMATSRSQQTTHSATKSTTGRQQQQQQPRESSIGRKVRPKNFLCPSCKMAFSNNGQLRNHARIHTGERPFTCQYDNCNKTFTRNEELTRHKLIHSGFRPHSCTTCGKRFGRKDHLKKHLRTHENKRNRQLRNPPISLASMFPSNPATTLITPTSASLVVSQAKSVDMPQITAANPLQGPRVHPPVPSIEQLASEYYRWYSLICQSNGQYSQAPIL